MPAKFSHRNDSLDHMPVTAWPSPLNEQQRQQIYKAVMAENSQAAADATPLKPGSSLSFAQRRDMQPMPEAVASMDGLQELKFVKGKVKVLWCGRRRELSSTRSLRNRNDACIGAEFFP